MPTYNRAALMGETLTSILNQTRPADEVIVVDDGSTDATQQMLAAYAGRVTALHQPNSGDLAARNRGLRAAQSSLVAFCDSDDLWQPEYLASMARLFAAEPMLGAAYGNFRLLQGGLLSEVTKFDDAPIGFWDELRTVSPEAGVFDESAVSRAIVFQPFFPSAMVVNRAVFLRLGGWDEGVSRIIGCDFATALRVLDAPPIGVLHAPLVSIRKHASNISGDSAKMNLGDANVLEYVLVTRPELDHLRSLIVHSICDRRMAAMDTCYGRMDFAQARMIAQMIPPRAMPLRLKVKAMVAQLPSPLARLVACTLDPSRRHLPTPAVK